MPSGIPQTEIEAIYLELKEVAARLLSRERDGHTLQRTALAHEAFIKMFGRKVDPSIPIPQFLALAAHQMRQILIDYGRKRSSQKRGGDVVRVSIKEADRPCDRDDDSLLALDQALERLGKIDARALSVVELKFFCGYTTDEAAKVLGISDGTVEADWQFARSWLFGALGQQARHFGYKQSQA